MYFVERFPAIMPDEATEDQLETEFLKYQVDPLPGIDCSKRIDECWHNVGQIKSLDSSQPRYGLLSHVMLSILMIPHSNADSE